MTRPAYSSRPTYDVIVVGAGLTGAVAARELRHAGHHVLVLEARERVGGRIWTSDHFEEQRDLGATFVHWTQPHIWAEIARYRFPLTQRPPLERTVWRVGDERFTGDALALQQFIAEGMTEYCADAREVYPQPYARAATSRLEEVDELSMADRIATLSASDEVKAIIHGFWSVNCNRDCSEGALTHALHWLSLTGGDWRVFNEACARYKLAGGMGTLLAAILGEGRPTMHLSCPVDLIERTDDGVRVATSTHGEFRALACIVTAPLNSLDNIEFVPQLSTGKREAIVEGAPTGGFKLWVKLRNPIESCLCLAPGSEPLMFARYEARLSSGCLMGCYGADRDLLLGDRTAVQDAIESWLPGSIVEDVWTYDWAGDPYCRETWRVPRPRQLTRFAAELESPEGRVLLAGSDYARGWNGFMDGAVESALTSAHAVKALLA